MKKIAKGLLVIVALFVLCGNVFAGGHGPGGRGGHGPAHFRPAPVVHHGGHGHHHTGNWLAGALVTGVTLGVLDIAAEALAPKTTVIAPPPPPPPAPVVVQQPAPVVIQQPAPVVQQPQVIYVQQPAPVVQQPQVIYTTPRVVTPTQVVYP